MAENASLLALPLSDRVNRIKPSPTLAVTQRASTLRAQGKDILDLGVGEPDFDTPDYIKEAAIKAIRDGKTKYTAVDGIPSLKEAIVQKFSQFNKLNYNPNQIIVSTGGKQCIFNLLQAYINPGDEVIIPAPYWVSYPDMTLLVGGKPVIIPTTLEQRFKITAEQLEAAITPKTKIFMINSPSNPSGLAYTKEELLALAEVLLRHPDVLIATDDMYEHILWDNKPFYNLAMVCPELIERTVVLTGVSKTYAMTGWRLGYAAGPEKLIKAMVKVQGQSTSNPCSISQAAAEAALRGNLDSVQKMVTAFKQRHDYIVKELNQIPGMECLEGDGTFYAFPRVKKLIDLVPGIHNDLELSEYLLLNLGIAVVPGSAFGSEGYLRFSFATSMTVLEDTIGRLKKIT
jgi:aspartate aminotransferase